MRNQWFDFKGKGFATIKTLGILRKWWKTLELKSTGWWAVGKRLAGDEQLSYDISPALNYNYSKSHLWGVNSHDTKEAVKVPWQLSLPWKAGSSGIELHERVDNTGIEVVARSALCLQGSVHKAKWQDNNHPIYAVTGCNKCDSKLGPSHHFTVDCLASNQICPLVYPSRLDQHGWYP